MQGRYPNGSPEVSPEGDNAPQYRRPNGASYANGPNSREEIDETRPSESLRTISLDPEDGEKLKRTVVALSEKGKLTQEAVRILGEKQETDSARCKERDKVFKDLAKLYETQGKTVVALQSTVAMLSAQIADLSMKLQESENRSCDGTLLWKISDYGRRKREAASPGPASFYSDSFYTTRHGYRTCARVYLNGDGIGKGTHLSIFFAIKKGDHDVFLRWPFRQRVTFRLMNQAAGAHIEDAFRPDPDSSSFARPQRDMNIASGCPLFVSHEVLENPQRGFLKDDTIYLQVKVDTTDL